HPRIAHVAQDAEARIATFHVPEQQRQRIFLLLAELIDRADLEMRVGVLDMQELAARLHLGDELAQVAHDRVVRVGHPFFSHSAATRSSQSLGRAYMRSSRAEIFSPLTGLMMTFCRMASARKSGSCMAASNASRRALTRSGGTPGGATTGQAMT